MHRLIRSTLALTALWATTTVWAQAPAEAASAPATGAPAGFVAPAEPKPDDNNAQRGKSQPGNNAPLWRAVREQGGISSLPGAEKGVLIQPVASYPGAATTNAGEAWRQVRNRWILPYGGALIFITVLALALFYWRKGALGGHAGPNTGRMVERFTPFERAAHWTNAGAFVVLALSGLVMAFGKFTLLLVMGSTLFGWLAYALKFAHNFVGPLFAVSLLVVIVTFMKDNIANAADVEWLRKAGGMLGGEQIKSHRFNAAEKGVYWWGVCVPGLVVVASGLVMDKLIPGLEYLRGDMQIANMIHAVMAMAMMIVLIGHIYMGTIGVKDAYQAMRTGYVDETWAKEHHELWLDDIKAGKIPAVRSQAGSAEPTPLSRQA